MDLLKKEIISSNEPNIVNILNYKFQQNSCDFAMKQEGLYGYHRYFAVWNSYGMEWV